MVAKAAEVACNVPELTAGRYHIKVLTSHGLAAHPAEHTDELAFVSILQFRGLSPAEGSFAGGQLVTIHGAGFGTDAGKVAVNVDTQAAEIVSIAHGAIVITAPECIAVNSVNTVDSVFSDFIHAGGCQAGGLRLGSCKKATWVLQYLGAVTAIQFTWVSDKCVARQR